MSGHAAVVLAFLLGLVLEVGRRTWGRWTRGRAILCAAFGAFMLVWGLLGPDDMDLVLYAAFVSLSMLTMLAVMFRDVLLPEVREYGLVAYTPVFWVLGLLTFPRASPGWWGLVTLGVPGTLLTTWLVATRGRPRFAVRVGAAVWTLVLLVSLVGAQFLLGAPWAVRGTVAPLATAVATGAVVGYLLPQAMFLFLLVRPPSRGESLSEWRASWWEHVEALAGRWSGEQAQPGRAVLVAVVGVVLVGTALLVTTVPAALAVNSWILLGPQLGSVGAVGERSGSPRSAP